MASLKMVELQILKFDYRGPKPPFEFRGGLSLHREGIICPRPLSQSGGGFDKDLMLSGNIEELEEYTEESWVGWGNSPPEKAVSCVI